MGYRTLFLSQKLLRTKVLIISFLFRVLSNCTKNIPKVLGASEKLKIVYPTSQIFDYRENADLNPSSAIRKKIRGVYVERRT